MGRGQLCLEQFCESSSAGRTDSQRSRSHTQDEAGVCHRVTVQKSHILGKCILFEQCAMLSKRPKNTVACCYETYRVRREGKSWEHFLIFICCDISTDRGCKGVGRRSCSHVGVIYRECLYYWSNLPRLANWGYFVMQAKGNEFPLFAVHFFS